MGAPVAVILAAGKSTRMKSSAPKVLHEVCGRPMIEYVLDAARAAGAGRLVVIVGHEAEQVKRALAHHPDVEFALQAQQKGTGHAVMMCRENLQRHDGPVFILTGDAPLMRAESFEGLLEDYRSFSAAMVIGTAETEDNFGLGRIVRNSSGAFLRIVEERDATPEERLIQEVNVGCYVCDRQALFAALEELQPANQQGEYYLTDCAAIIKEQGRRVVASKKLDFREALGVNTRKQLTEVQRAMQEALMERLLADGVSVMAPELTYIDPRAKIGADTVIQPFSAILGPAVIGSGCRIGPHAVVGGAAELADGTRVEPFQSVGLS